MRQLAVFQSRPVSHLRYTQLGVNVKDPVETPVKPCGTTPLSRCGGRHAARARRAGGPARAPAAALADALVPLRRGDRLRGQRHPSRQAGTRRADAKQAVLPAWDGSGTASASSESGFGRWRLKALI